jgi:hypothetical protein
LGIALYGTMMFWLVALIRPRAAGWLIALVAVAICWGVEFFQLTPIPAAINKHVPLMRLVLGEHFSWWDLVGYVVGVLAGYSAHAIGRGLWTGLTKQRATSNIQTTETTRN